MAIIEVPDISIVKTVNGNKQLLSLRDQKIKKDGALHTFGTGSGIKHNEDLYVLKEYAVEIPIVTMKTTKNNPSFAISKSGDVEVDWGDGTRDKNTFSHTYFDGLSAHEIKFYGKNTALIYLACSSNQITLLDTSGCEMLDSLDCHENNIYSLNINGCVRLRHVEAYANQLTSVSVVGLKYLEYINLNVNPNLSHFDVHSCTKLNFCTAFATSLQSLDISECVELKELWIFETDIINNRQAMMILANSLPDRTGKADGTLDIRNATSKAWIQSICEAKNWTIK